MLTGALVGFVAGAVIGLGGGSDMAQPIVLPLIGALVGASVAWLPFAWGEIPRRRDRARERELDHERIRAQAHEGWIEGIDLLDDEEAVRARRAAGASARRTPPA
jgi:hypothetical protein